MWFPYKKAVGSKSLKQAVLITLTYDITARSINLQFNNLLYVSDWTRGSDRNVQGGTLATVYFFYFKLKLNVWMMPLSKRSFSECWGVMCQLLGQQQEPGSGHFIYIPSHGGREC